MKLFTAGGFSSPLYTAYNCLLLLLLIFLLPRIPFFKRSGLTGRQITGLYCIKIVAAWGNTFYYSAGTGCIGGDPGTYFYASLTETNVLLHHPLYFFSDLFQHHYLSAGNLFLENSYWNDLKSMFMIKLLAISNVVTLKSYFGDILLFNCFYFLGLTAFFRLADELFPGRRKLLILTVFCIPSFLFWCCSLHKDGLVFSATGLIFYYFYHAVTNGFTFKRGIIILAGMLLLFVLRNYVCFLFLPVLLGWWLASRYSLPPLTVFTAVYITCLVLFFTSSRISVTLDFPAYITTRRQAFKAIENHTRLTVPDLSPDFNSFAHYLPVAVDSALFRPHIREIKSWLYYPLLMELYLLLILCQGAYLFRNKKQVFPVAAWACLFFAGSILLMIGYIVTFSGAIIRYRSLVFPLILTVSIGYLDLPRIRKSFTFNSLKRHCF